jgi:hypothetical protein
METNTLATIEAHRLYSGIETIKAVLHHANGAQSEILIGTPIYTDMGEAVEMGAMFLKRYILKLVERHFIEIDSYVIKVGRFTDDSFQESFSYEPQRIVVTAPVPAY